MLEAFYNQLAPYYKYIFQDWDRSVLWHAEVLDSVIREIFGPGVKTILDAACGVGTQCIGLAQRGYAMTASDISAVAVDSARVEAQKRSLKIEFGVADMRCLWSAYQRQFDLVIACDNAVPHLLSDQEILQVFEQFYRCTTPAGGCIISVRDYASLEIPAGGRIWHPRTVHDTATGRVILFDLWEFSGENYDITMYIIEDEGQPEGKVHIVRGGRYYCIHIDRLEKLFLQAGFQRVATIKDRYFQPLLVASR